MMKYVLITLAVVLLAVMAYLLLFTDVIAKNKDQIPEEIIDGGHNDSSNEDAPKLVKSDEITSFSLVFSTLSWADEEYFGEGIYRLEAVKTEKDVLCKYQFNPYYGDREAAEFRTNEGFLKKLDEVVKRYNLSIHNGKNVFVSGLPDMYGEEIDVVYASGESICAYDNQDGFIGRDAIFEIEKLFTDETETE